MVYTSTQKKIFNSQNCILLHIVRSMSLKENWIHFYCILRIGAKNAVQVYTHGGVWTLLPSSRDSLTTSNVLYLDNHEQQVLTCRWDGSGMAQVGKSEQVFSGLF